MDNVLNYDSFITIPSSQTGRPYLHVVSVVQIESVFFSKFGLLWGKIYNLQMH
jgi:hypothetical protein